MPKIDPEKAKQWLVSDNKDYALPETFDIAGVEVFATGKWNGDQYTVNDLDSMVEAFGDTQEKMKPYLKLGHSEDQPLLRDSDLPAAGWISNLYRRGDKLFADFSRVPKKIYDLIKAGAYRRVSSEIFWNMKVGDKVYKRLLKAVALLGGETPAVHDLNDIMALYALGGSVEIYEASSESKTYEVEKEYLDKSQEKKPMPKQDAEDTLEGCTTALGEAKKKMAKMEEDYAKLHSEQVAEARKLSEENASLKKTIEGLQVEKKHASINATLDKLVADKKINPNQKAILFGLMANTEMTGEKKYKVGDKEFDTVDSLVLAFAESNTAGLSTEASSEVGGEQAKDLADKATKYAEQHKVSYKEALIAVSRAEK